MSLPEPIEWTTRQGWELAPQSRPSLDKVAETLIQLGDTVAAIDAHTFAMGPQKYGEGPRRRRADVIRRYLIDRGVAPERVLARDMSDRFPIASNNTKDGRDRNRRVEIRLFPRGDCAPLYGPSCRPPP